MLIEIQRIQHVSFWKYQKFPSLRLNLLMSTRIILLIFAVLACNATIKAQKGPEVGAWLGLGTYYGDLQTRIDISNIGLAGGLNFRYNFNSRLAYKISLNYIRVHAEDSDSPNTFERERNLSFFSDIFEMNHQFEFNFLRYVHGSENEFYTPYLFGGFSALFYSPKTRLDFNNDGNSEVYVLRNFGTEGQAFGAEYGRLTFAINYGMGFKFDIAQEWSINIEIGGRSVFTDYLDDVSTVYPDKNILGQLRGDIALALSDRTISSLDLSQAGNQRGNSRDRDFYYVFGVSIMKYFGNLPCPKLGKPGKNW